MIKTVQELALEQAAAKGGKLEITPTVKLDSMEDMSIAYTPGVAAVCMEIANDKAKAYDYTTKRNLVAVITDGSAVLGLGNIGPEAGIPVMEGKAILFKAFGGVDAVPISLNTQDQEKIVEYVAALAPSFGGINLEDISAPRCFYIEEKLKEMLDIPVFHDDQHGTAIVVLGGLINALKLVNKDIANIRIVINGAGAAGTSMAHLLMSAGATDVVMLNSKGIICDGDESLSPAYKSLAKVTNPNHLQGTLEDAVKGADVFCGVSAPGVLKKEWVATMNNKAIVFAMANPTPEIFPNEAKEAGAYVVGTGRSDFPNQVNNVLAFPGIFRGALDARASDITQEMKLAAARAIASLVSEEELNPDFVLPNVFDARVAKAVAKAVSDEVEKSRK